QPGPRPRRPLGRVAWGRAGRPLARLPGAPLDTASPGRPDALTLTDAPGAAPGRFRRPAGAHPGRIPPPSHMRSPVQLFYCSWRRRGGGGDMRGGDSQARAVSRLKPRLGSAAEAASGFGQRSVRGWDGFMTHGSLRGIGARVLAAKAAARLGG